MDSYADVWRVERDNGYTINVKIVDGVFDVMAPGTLFTLTPTEAMSLALWIIRHTRSA